MKNYAAQLAAREPVTVSFAVLRCCAPKDFLRQERYTKLFMVHPDDRIEPMPEAPIQ